MTTISSEMVPQHGVQCARITFEIFTVQRVSIAGREDFFIPVLGEVC